MPHDEEDFDLSEDDWKLINSVVHPEQMSIEEALRSSDPLGNINNNLPGKTPSQRTFRLLFAAILEVNSACVPILFERFTQRELAKIHEKFRELDARRFCSAIDILKKVIENNLGAKPSKSAIARLFDSTMDPEIATIIAENTSIVAEMEEALLAYARTAFTDLKD